MSDPVDAFFDEVKAHGASASDVSGLMEKWLDHIQDPASTLDANTKAASLTDLAARFIGEHVAMHAAARHAIGPEQASDSGIRHPTTQSEVDDFLKKHSGVLYLMQVAAACEIFAVPSGASKAKLSYGSDTIRGKSIHETQRRICALLTQPTADQLPLCEALWANVGPLKERVEALSSDFASLANPDDDWMPLPQLVPVIATGVIKVNNKECPYEVQQSSGPDLEEPSGTEGSSSLASRGRAKLGSFFKSSSGGSA